MSEDRSNIHLLAAMLRAANNFKLPMQDCINAAEGALAEAEIVDAEMQIKLQQEEAAAKAMQPVKGIM